MNIDNIFYIIKSAIIHVSVPSNIWQRSFRTTLHSRQSQSIRFNPGYGGLITVSLNSTQLNEHLCMQVLKHLNVHIYLVSRPMAYRYYNQLISRTDGRHSGLWLEVTHEYSSHSYGHAATSCNRAPTAVPSTPSDAVCSVASATAHRLSSELLSSVFEARLV